MRGSSGVPPRVRLWGLCALFEVTTQLLFLKIQTLAAFAGASADLLLCKYLELFYTGMIHHTWTEILDPGKNAGKKTKTKKALLELSTAGNSLILI